MKQELAEALVRDFPNLYKVGLYLVEFRHGDGWEPLIRRLSEQLEHTGVYCSQCKEKFGGLRFYVCTPDDADGDLAYKLIDDAEAESVKICELCGCPGSTRKYSEYWIRTVCDQCASK